MIPKLRFPQFKDDLNSTKFANTADKTVKRSITGGPFGSDLKSEDYTETGVRIIQLQNIGDGIFIDKSKIYTSNEKADTLSACNIFAGELILSKMGDPVARACKMPLQDDRYLMSSDGIRYVPDESLVDKEFIYQYINSSRFRKQAEAVSTGSTRKRIGLSDLKNIDIRFPSLAEQRKISGLLLNLDQKINLLTKKKEALETYKKGLMQKIFSQELRFKREDGTYYPKWKKVTLGSTCKVLRGKELPKSVISKDGLYKCIHYGELFTYYGEVIAFVNSFTDNRDGTLSQFGDVLMPSSDVTPYGLMTASMVQEDNVYLGGDINIVRPNQTIDCEVYSWDSAFLSFYLNSIPKVLMRLISGTTVKHLYTSDLKGVELWQPTKKEQELCSRLFLSINSKIEILEKELFAIHNLKKGLLQQMFV